MPVLRFPDPRNHPDPDGLIAVGGDLHPDTLKLAYRSGIFPWPMEGLPMTWFSPPLRAILRHENLHVSRSLRNSINRFRSRGIEVRMDTAFEDVISACASIPRGGQETDPDTGGALTWITPGMNEAYCRLHRDGSAHSIEAWRDGELVAGLYGVDAGGVFAGESMFTRINDGSKFLVTELMKHLKSRGLDWMDIQMMTPHMEALGAENVPRSEFLDLLQSTFKKNLVLF